MEKGKRRTATQSSPRSAQRGAASDTCLSHGHLLARLPSGRGKGPRCPASGSRAAAQEAHASCWAAEPGWGVGWVLEVPLNRAESVPSHGSPGACAHVHESGAQEGAGFSRGRAVRRTAGLQKPRPGTMHATRLRPTPCSPPSSSLAAGPQFFRYPRARLPGPKDTP